jgi:pimeloyl-ACP methyl ester carboxylesterase
MPIPGLVKRITSKLTASSRAAWSRLRPPALAATVLPGAGGMAVALAKLSALTRLLRVEKTTIQGVPVTCYRSANSTGNDMPAVVLVHGFAASQQIMAPFAVTLARHGYAAVTLDLPGHGQNPTPLHGELGNFERRYQLFAQALEPVVAFARSCSDGRVVLLGHSMGSAAVTRYAQDHPDINSVVAVSLVYDQITADSPRNLLILNGALEIGLRRTAYRVMQQVAGHQVQEGITYGSIANGTARRFASARCVEHMGVLFSPDSLCQALAWFNQCLNRPPHQHPFLDDRIRWLGLHYASATLLFWPVARVVSMLAPPLPLSSSPAMPRRWWFALALAPSLVTPILIRLIPPRLSNRLLPVLVGGPTALFFALYGLLTAGGLALAHTRRTGTLPHVQPFAASLLRSVPAALLMVGYVFLAFGLPAQRFLLNYFPVSRRLPVTAAAFAAMLPYFIADEILAHTPGAPRGAYAITKASFLASLALAVALNPYQFFFLIIASPILAAYFVLYGTFSNLVYQQSGNPMPGALANAAIFATSVSAVFPLTDLRSPKS